MIHKTNALLFGCSPITITLSKRPLLTNIDDLMHRMVATQRFNFVTRSSLFLANVNASDKSGLIKAFEDRLPDGFDMKLKFKTTIEPKGDHTVLAVDRLRLKLVPHFTYLNPVSFAKSVALSRRFSLPPGEELIIHNVLSDFFLQEPVSIVSLLNHCFAFEGLQIKDFRVQRDLEMKIDENTLTLSASEGFSLSVTEADELLFQCDTLMQALVNSNKKEIKVILGQDLRLILSQDTFAELEKLDVLDLGAVCEIVFPQHRLPGLDWEVTHPGDVEVELDQDSAELPLLILSSEKAFSLRLTVSNPADMITQIIEDKDESVLEGLEVSDPRVFNYVLFQTFLLILVGPLSGFSIEDLEELGLKEKVLGVIKDWKEKSKYLHLVEDLRENYFDTVDSFFGLTLDEFSNLSIDQYAKPVQTLLKAIVVLREVELKDSRFLMKSMQAARNHFEGHG